MNEKKLYCGIWYDRHGDEKLVLPTNEDAALTWAALADIIFKAWGHHVVFEPDGTHRVLTSEGIKLGHCVVFAVGHLDDDREHA